MRTACHHIPVRFQMHSSSLSFLPLDNDKGVAWTPNIAPVTPKLFLSSATDWTPTTTAHHGTILTALTIIALVTLISVLGIILLCHELTQQQNIKLEN